MAEPAKPTNEQFDQLVAEALNSLPRDIAAAMENVAVVVEDEPPAEALKELPLGNALLGLYHGIPLTERDPQSYHSALPDRISIYRGPITRLFRDRQAIKEQIRKTVIHEVAHHFGIDDARLNELGWS